MSIDRETLRRVVGGVLWNATNYPRKAQPYLLGTDTAPLTGKVVDAVLAALIQQPEGTVEYMFRVPGEIPSGAIRATREEILEDKQYVEARWGKRDAVQRTVGPWTEVAA